MYIHIHRPSPLGVLEKTADGGKPTGGLGIGWQGPREGKLSISERTFPIITRGAGAIRDPRQAPVLRAAWAKNPVRGQSQLNRGKKAITPS